ncbi:MAG: right-handed parallel beta-helix repeat-containing protein [Thaumarchaeota archaeon]|nr:right-handed parallel beta-helix repeat-containing protein [Nitrososphaerota archaeon]
MDIPGLQPPQQDIYSFGFNKSLNREIPASPSGSPVYDANNNSIDAAQIAPGGNLSLNSLSISSLTKTLNEGDNIQEVLNAIKSEGGGELRLKIGTYTVNYPIVLPSNVAIIGESMEGTVINFNSTSGNISATGSSVYTAGTITSITGGVNVTGSGTSWLANVTTDHQFFIGNKWYQIAAVTSNTTIILAEGYVGGASFPGASYRASKIVHDIAFKNLTIKNSTGTALSGTDIRFLTMNNVIFSGNNKGFTLTNVSESVFDIVTSTSNTSNGIEITNGKFINSYSVSSAGNGGQGVVLNNLTTGGFILCSADSNTLDGYNVTSCSDVNMNIDASSNGVNGAQLVSGNENIIISDALIQSNTNDGVKLTASSNNCRIRASKIKNNGGYGVNVAASSDNTNIISICVFSSNTSGDVNDAGTGTIISSCSPNTVNNGGGGSIIGFGGDGSDGALTISSGTTTINLGGAEIVIKNYTSISITGTGVLAFSNPASTGTKVMLRSKGNVTITSSATNAIDYSGTGGAGGAGGASTTNGVAGTGAYGVYDTLTHYGAGGVYTGVATNNGGAGGLGLTPTPIYTVSSQRINFHKNVYLSVGSGGGGGCGGSLANTTGGNGGAGGGGLFIECRGYLNFTGNISVAGVNGGNGTNSANCIGGGGGGGGGGSCVILYNYLTANSGVITSTGGSAGLGGTVTAGVGGAGGGGGASYGGSAANGSNGNSSVAGAGGVGSNGFSFVAQNTLYA